ncbi:accessory Sec system translocase SecA2 [Planotetraspora sp. A-T 1434]|uniref:preprotein translocase subunit SecA n=1 Tax=Planotetraspora sp. A-T 1434 TaxID=2979219 RepID=UPI0021C12FF8|nr:accessory Sec system translocase SecA2 [Planotetraspora sp. A-T 1434]MCT9930977.1 accessory Sec system translocase SecA2 [Planotetraspora sp. A-T 1434]
MASVVGFVRRFLDKPGSVDLSPFERIVAEAGELEGEVRLRADLRPETVGTAEFCAVVREAARRTLGQRPFDVQLVGVLAMLNGHVVQMATGEGKTLAGALTAAGFALQGKRVHAVSVNDYLARRDAEWMAPLYEALGLTVGWIAETSASEERREAYSRDVTYAAVSELGFDVLRDRLRTDPADLVVPAPQVALVDEADSVLVDEARVPLVLAGAADPGAAVPEMAALVRRLSRGYHYKIDEEGRNVFLTPKGTDTVEKALGIDLYHDPGMVTEVNLALHAHALLTRDVDYIVRDGRVHLINPSRGRVAILQRWPDGLQAAVEAKEKLPASETGEILDSLTIQGLIRRYPEICGMTGTAVAVGEQLREFYDLRVAVIPPNKPCVRLDEPDRIYATAEEKERALLDEIAAQHATGRPILIGTLDVAESEHLDELLRARGLRPVVLNAKNDAEEAAIIAGAGARGAITVSTQMAGRGTDIRLGGQAVPDKAAQATAPVAPEPHPDGQAAPDPYDAGPGAPDEVGAGASGAAATTPGGQAVPEQDGDAAAREREVADLGGLYVIGTGRHDSSRLDDQLRGRAGRQGDPGGSVFFVSGEDALLTAYAPDESLPPADPDGVVRHKRAAELIAHAQRVAEGVNLEIHRNTWRYTRLLEQQRAQLLERRDRVLHGDTAAEALKEACPDRYGELSEAAGEDLVKRAARQIVLFHLDRCWTEHLGYLADLREGIHLRALGRLNPLDEFNREAVPAYRSLLDEVERRSKETFETADITRDLADQGLKRPTATWTYLVQDNPFGSEWDRILQRVSGALKRRKR